MLIYAQGIGPLKSSRNRLLTAKLLNKATAITVRDKESSDELQAMGVNKAITVTADPVLGLGRFGADGALGKEILSHYGWREDKKSLAIALRPWGGSQNFVAETAKAWRPHVPRRLAIIIFADAAGAGWQNQRRGGGNGARDHQ